MGKKKVLGPVPTEAEDEDEFQQELRALELINQSENAGDAPVLNRNLTQEIHQKIKEIQPVKMPWIERLDVASKKPVVISNVDDDFEREMAFYNQALEGVKECRQRILGLGMRFERPIDYFAEMIKTDQHMTKIRRRLVDETNHIKHSEEAAKQRKMKKYAKQLQAEKLQQKAKAKTETLDRINLIRKGKSTIDKLEDDFKIEIDEDKKGKGKGQNPQQKQQQKKVSNKRQQRDQQYGFGGKKRGAKRNTAESTNDFGVFKNPNKKKAKGGGKVTKKRPGKSRRTNMKNKK